jgi:hypothetical protein
VGSKVERTAEESGLGESRREAGRRSLEATMVIDGENGGYRFTFNFGSMGRTISEYLEGVENKSIDGWVSSDLRT